MSEFIEQRLRLAKKRELLRRGISEENAEKLLAQRERPAKDKPNRVLGLSLIFLVGGPIAFLGAVGVVWAILRMADLVEGDVVLIGGGLTSTGAVRVDPVSPAVILLKHSLVLAFGLGLAYVGKRHLTKGST